MRRSILLITAAVLPALSTAAWGQSPREQRMAFGGGGRFEFAIPVNAQGTVYIDASWSPGSAMHAYLFEPGHSHPIAEADGLGRVILSRQVDTWEAGKPWVLRIAASGRTSNVRGTLRVVYPSGNRPDVAVQWRDAGPTDVATLGQMARRIEGLRAAAAGANLLTSTDARDVVRIGSSTATAEIIDALQTRVDVLLRTPARYVGNTDGMNGTRAVTGPVVSGSRTLAVDFTDLRLQTNSPFHVDHERDAMYVVAAVIPQGTTPSAVGRSGVMRSLQPGDVEHAANGGQELARGGATRARVAVAVLEREQGNPDLAMARFANAADLFRLYGQDEGATAAEADFAWFVDVAMAGAGEAVVGVPMLLQVTETGLIDPAGHLVAWTSAGDGGRRAAPRLAFNGGGAKVDVALSVHSND